MISCAEVHILVWIILVGVCSSNKFLIWLIVLTWLIRFIIPMPTFGCSVVSLATDLADDNIITAFTAMISVAAAS
jgi:hypothetical protein